MKYRADMRGRTIARKIKLDGYTFPPCVGVRGNQISRNVARQNRNRIHADLGIPGATPAFERRSEPAFESLLDRTRTQGASHHIPNGALLRRQMTDIFRKQIDLDPRMRAVSEIVALAAAVHRPVINDLRHIREH